MAGETARATAHVANLRDVWEAHWRRPMRSLTTSRVLRVHVAALVAMALIVGSAATVVAGKPPKPSPPPPPSGSAPTITIAPTGTLEPDQVYANVDVTVTCAVGSTFTNGWIYTSNTIAVAPGRSHRPARERRRWPALGSSTAIASHSVTGPQGPLCESRRTVSRPRSRSRGRSRLSPASPCESRTRASSRARPVAAPSSR